MELVSRCTYTFETIEAYVLNRLNKRVKNQFQKHVTLCTRCRHAIEKEELFVATCRLVSIISCPFSNGVLSGQVRHR